MNKIILHWTRLHSWDTFHCKELMDFWFILRQEIERQEREKIRQEWVEEQEKIKSENFSHFSLGYLYVSDFI